MSFKLFEDAYNKRRDEFYSHVRPELRALAERKERITKAELPETMNSYEQRVIEPNLANDILMEWAEYCMSQAGRELGKFECPRHYNDAVERLYAPLLVKRLREAEAEIKKIRMGINVYRELTDAVNKTSDPGAYDAAHNCVDKWEEGPGKQIPFEIVPYIELSALSPLQVTTSPEHSPPVPPP